MTVVGAHLSHLGIYALLLCILCIAQAQDLPYNPSRILLSVKRHDLAYVFLPSSTTQESKLLSLNISASISSSSLDFKTITADLPFDSDSSQAYLPVIDDEDGITVYTGDCALGAAGSSLWKFTPGNGNTNGNGTWAKSTFEVSSGVNVADLPGANFLNSGFAFSTLLGETSSQGSIYVFGGMCPTATDTTEPTWQASANYSNHMLEFSPNTATEYSLGLSSLSTSPISEAGFSLTPLQVTTSNSTSQTLTQQQNFILLGGHTENAFTNFSQVAIFSLPEEAWSFQTIDSPSASSSADTELAVKSSHDGAEIDIRATAALIDSRSGHTAVLTEDGTKMVVFGGWVGDINTAANPQLAILDLGAGYGGSGDWEWTLPSVNGNGIADGTGLYGHGAAMLPGNVMMILGGYSISNSSSSSSKRATINSDAYFFNATNMTWTTSYTNPYLSSKNATSSGGTSSSTAKEVGLGVGLSCGFSAIFIAGLVYIWYSRRLRRQRRHTREKDLQALSYGAATYFSLDPRNDPIRSSLQDGNRTSPYYNYNNAYLTDHLSGYENPQHDSYANNAEIDCGVNSSPTGNRRNSAYKGKGVYQLAPSFDARGRSNSLGTAGQIHPIIEADEEDLTFTLTGVGVLSEPNSPSQTQHRNSITVAKRKPLSRPGTGSGSAHEPFVFKEKDHDGLRSHPISLHGAAVGGGNSTDRSSSNPSPESISLDPVGTAAERAAEREAEIKEWVNDWAAADALLNAQVQRQSHSSAYAGRISPTKYRRAAGIGPPSDENTSSGEGRTESNLSESARSAISNLTVSIGRSISQRSTSLGTFLTGAGNTRNTFSSSSPISPVFDRSASGYQGLGGGNYHQNQGSSGTSFTTALTHNSFPALRAEGESLLPRPAGAREEYLLSVQNDVASGGSPSKLTRGQGVRSASWLGTLRRALTGSGKTNQRNLEISHDSPMYWSDADSPTRGMGYGTTASDGTPRRTVSAGATLWRRKQGKVDWEDSEPKFSSNRSSAVRTRRSPIRGSDGAMDDPFIIGEDEKEMGGGDYNGKEKERQRSVSQMDDDEWDIERAVENRVVQVMFTVPRERLRVVNYDIEEDISEVGEGSGSLRRRISSRSKIRSDDLMDLSAQGELGGLGEMSGALGEMGGLDAPGPSEESAENSKEPEKFKMGESQGELGGLREMSGALGGMSRRGLDESPGMWELTETPMESVKLEMKENRPIQNRSPGRVRNLVERFEGRSPAGSPVAGRSPERSPMRK